MDILDYISCALQIKREIIFTVLTTISIFLLGQSIAWISKKLDKRKDLYDKEIYFIELLASVSHPISLQVNKLKEYTQVLKDDEDKTPMLVHISQIHLNKINAFPTEEAFKIWVRRKKGDVKINVKLFNSLYDSIDIALKLLDYYPKMHRDYIDAIRKYQDDFDINFDSILENMQSLYVNLNPDSQLLKVLNDMESQFIEIDRSIRSNLYRHVVQPLLDQMVLLENEERFKVIDKNIQRCNQSFFRILKVRSSYALRFEEHILKLEKSSREIDEITSKLKSLKNKSIFFS